MAKYEGITGLDFAYKGFQYPLPPTWKRAIRIEDQINWLLQAILYVDNETISNSELNEAIETLKTYVDNADSDLQNAIDELQEGWKTDDAKIWAELEKLVAGLFLMRNPIDGDYTYAYNALRQVYDAARPYAITYADLDYLGAGQEAIYPSDSTRYFRYEDLDGLPWGSYTASGVMVTDGELFPAPAPDASGRMATAEYATTDELCYQALNAYGRFVAYGIIAKRNKNANMSQLLNTALNVAITPAAALQDVTPGYNMGISVFTTYGQMDANGVMGYVPTNE